MPAPHPRMHGLDHAHGGPDPVLLAWEDVGGVAPPSGGGGTTTGSPASGSVSGSGATDADLVLTLPSFVAGDLMFLSCGSYDNATLSYGIATPAGYTSLYTPPTSSDNRRGPWLYYRIMDGTEGPTVTISSTGYVASSNSLKGCVAWGWHVGGATQDVDGAVVVTSGSFSGTTLQDVTAGPATATQANEIVLAFGWLIDTSGSFPIESTVTAPVVEQYDILSFGSSGPGKTWLGLATDIQATPGPKSVTVKVGYANPFGDTYTWRYAAVGIKTA